MIKCQPQSSSHLLYFKGSDISKMPVTGTIKRAERAAGYCYIDQYGNPQTAQYLADGMFTMLTTTGQTIHSTTSRRSHLQSTRESMEYQGHGLPVGKLARPELKHIGKKSNLTLLSVRSADQSDWCDPQDRHVFAEAIVENVTECEFPEPVYDLTVDGQPEFFANDLLVHNCNFVPGQEKKSPDRMDALVWAVYDLALQTQASGVMVVDPYQQISPI